MPDEFTVDRRPFLFRSRDDSLSLCIEHEHSGRRLHEAGAASNAAFALHADGDRAPGIHPGVARNGPLLLAIEGGDRGAIAFIHDLAEVVEVEAVDVLYARVNIKDGRRSPLTQPQLEQGLHRDLGGAYEDRGESLVLRVGPERVRRRDVDRQDQLRAQDTRSGDGKVVQGGTVHIEPAADLPR